MSDESWSFLRSFFGVSEEAIPQTTTNIICKGCGIVFSVPKAYADAKEESHDKFYCPNGHVLRLGVS